ncbi:MAG: M48 family metalloprotease, partial [Candidatus Omnitrophica bacterium]|nr:M48 family metalloprotease [Candidatus Omnitrophota bacterium]
MPSDKAKSYWRHKYSVTFVSLAVSFVFLSVFQLSGSSAAIRASASKFTENFYITCLIYISVFSLTYGAVMFPLDFYEGYAIERRFGLSNQSLASWLKDEAKKSAISFAFFLFLIEAFYAIARCFPATWTLAASLFWITLSVVLAKVFPLAIIPIFYRYSPLSSQDLKKKVLHLADKFGIKVLDVFEIDFSTKTKKSNAAVVGWGGSRRVILADNLVNEFSTEEAGVVVAHEMAHHKRGHMWKLIAFNAI